MEYGVYLVTQADRSAGRSTVEVVEAAIRGGVDVVQLREKDRPASERYELGHELRELTREIGEPLPVLFLVEDQLEGLQVLSRVLDDYIVEGHRIGDVGVPTMVM